MSGSLVQRLHYENMRSCHWGQNNITHHSEWRSYKSHNEWFIRRGKGKVRKLGQFTPGGEETRREVKVEA